MRLKISERGVEKTYELAEFAQFAKHPSAKTGLLCCPRFGAAGGPRESDLSPLISEYAKAMPPRARKNEGLAALLERSGRRVGRSGANARDR